MAHQSAVESALEQGKGILRLAPTWVPRSFCIPGKRLKLHPDDYYKLGLVRGGIDERWFSSTVHADNGPLTPGDEGLSYIVVEDGKTKPTITLLEAVDLLKDQIIGERLYEKYQKWPMFSKFFDNWGPLPFHIHQDDDHAALVGEAGKPEMYYFPPQLNNHGGTFPFTFFGLNPGTTKAQLKNCLAIFEQGDNKIVDLSRAYKLRPGTGWDVPPGVLHAPGSLCTYEPQFASDVFAMYESVLYGGETVPVELLWKNTPEDKMGDLDYLVGVVDWALNTDPNFYENRFMPPVACRERCRNRTGGLSGKLDLLPVCVCQRKAACGHARKDGNCQRSGCLWFHQRTGIWHHQRHAVGNPIPDPLWRPDV